MSPSRRRGNAFGEWQRARARVWSRGALGCGHGAREGAGRGSGMPIRAPRHGAAARWGHRALPQRDRKAMRPHGKWSARWGRQRGKATGHGRCARQRDRTMGDGNGGRQRGTGDARGNGTAPWGTATGRCGASREGGEPPRAVARQRDTATGARVWRAQRGRGGGR